jgi:hypothetical protein
MRCTFSITEISKEGENAKDISDVDMAVSP